MKLNQQPTGNVTVALASEDDTQVTVSQASLTFNRTNWNTPQTVTVTVVDNQVDHGSIPELVIWHTPSGGGFISGGSDTFDLEVSYNDNDTAGVTVSKSSVTVTEASGSSNTATYTVVLDTQPTGTVTVTPASSDTGVATVSAALRFTTANWNTAQPITVTGVDDSTSADRSTTITHAISGGGYGSVVIPNVSVTLTDNDNSAPTGTVTITGTATQGQTLTADTSTISDPDGPSSLTFTYQWKRGVTVISGGSTHVLTTDISSATGSTYTLTQADVGAVITVTVRWTDTGGTAESLTSVATANVANINDSPTGTITGTATQGQTLIAATAGISDPDGPSNLIFSYQWKRDSTAISGANGNTYVLKQADVGAAITVTVSWTDAGGAAESLTSAATSTVTVTSSTVPPPGGPCRAHSDCAQWQSQVSVDRSQQCCHHRVSV